MKIRPPKFVLFLLLLCLAGVGFYYSSDNWKGDEPLKENEIQTTPNLKLLTSHSSPRVGEKWIVSFETRGNADLFIIPEDPESIDDLDFVSLTCEGKEKTEVGPLQILDSDVIFYPNWSCNGKGELTHLVNVARKHTLKFRFGDKAAFAYNNPDSVTDTFDDETKIAVKENITVSGGQVKLAICKDNGTACSAAEECCSGYCVDGYCCNTACDGTCQACAASKTGGSNGTCANITNNTDPDNECAGICKVCQSGACGNATAGTDPKNQCTTASPPNPDSCKDENCSGEDYGCGYLAAGEQNQPACKRCSGSSYDPVNVDADNPGNVQDNEGSNLCNNTTGICYRCNNGICTFQTASQDIGNQCPASNCNSRLLNSATGQSCATRCANTSLTRYRTGYCSGTGYSCHQQACSCSGITTSATITNSKYCLYDTKYNTCDEGYIGGSTACNSTMPSQGYSCTCGDYTHTTYWTRCVCVNP